MQLGAEPETVLGVNTSPSWFSVNHISPFINQTLLGFLQLPPVTSVLPVWFKEATLIGVNVFFAKLEFQNKLDYTVQSLQGSAMSED